MKYEALGLGSIDAGSMSQQMIFEFTVSQSQIQDFY